MAYPKRLEPVPPEQLTTAYREIGRFITSVADLDSSISTLLAAVAQMHGDGHDLIVQSIDFNRKREILRSLKRIGAKSVLYTEMISLVDKADALMTKRHIVAHGILATQDGKLIMSSLSLPALAKYAAGDGLLDVEELPGYSDRADEFAERLFAIAQALRPEQSVPRVEVALNSVETRAPDNRGR